MLYGRGAEIEHLRAVVAAAIAGRSVAVVVAGDAGIGKSALVDEIVRSVTAARVLRTDGVQTEAHVALSGLFDVLTPILDFRHELPDPQRAVLERAFAMDGALERPTAEDPLSLRVATHALLAVAAETYPLIVVVDDAQWVDRESLQNLVFAVRRLHADRVGFLFAVRVTAADVLPAEVTDLPVLTLQGLDTDASRALLLAQEPELTDRAVIETICVTAQGNPLALIEIPGLLGPDPMAGGVLSRPLPIGEVIKGSVTPRLARLPDRTGQALVIASAAHDLRRDNVSGALAQVGLDMTDLAPAEDAHLIRLSPRFGFEHPLVRASVYHAAAPSARRAAHRALAAAATGSRVTESRAWHLAAAASGPDPEVAELLVDAGAQARRHGAADAATAAFRQAAHLTGDPHRRAELLLEAARSAVHGEPQSATDLAAAAADTTSDPIVRAHAHRIMAARWNTGGDVRRAVAMLKTDAECVRLLDPKLSVTLLLEAAGPALHAADRALAEDVAEQALAQSVALDEELEFAARVTRGWVDLCWGDIDPALPFGVPWDELVAAVPHGPGVLPNVVATLPWLDMDAQARVVIERLQAKGRDLRDPSTLPFALAAGSELDYRAGRWPAGIAAATEAAGLATELGDHNTRARCLINLAWFDAAMGHERQCRARVAEAIDIAQRSGTAALQTFGTAATGLLAMTLGDYETAASDLRRVQRGLAEHGVMHPGIVSWAEDLAEALYRCGQVDAAHEVLDAHAVRVSRAGYRPGEMAILRARLAMRHDGPEIEKAIASVAATMASTVPFEYARYLLTYGEWLHLRDRRTAARTPLQEAHSLLARLGAAPWAERARAGLRAAGGKVDGRPEPPALSSLTPQEIRVARAAANGQRNREIAASLFLSTKTVESYLSSVYRKLAIRSRSQLVTVLVENGAL